LTNLKLAYQYLGKAVADGLMSNCVRPVKSVYNQIGHVIESCDPPERMRDMKNKSIVQTVKIGNLVIGTEQPEKFIDAIENLCRVYASVQDAENGDGYTFKFNVEN